MDSMDILSLRAEALPEGLPGEQVYSLLFAPIEEEGPTDLMDMRRQAWQEGRIMRKSSGGESREAKARRKEIAAYIAWIRCPVDIEQEF